jgi:thiamine pyrophosphokinase
LEAIRGRGSSERPAAGVVRVLIATGAATDLPPGLAAEIVIAADGGLRALTADGRHVDHVVGDLDSAAPADVDLAARRGTAIHRHPTDKDATDLELALELARALGATAVTIVSGPGERLDHLLGEAALLAADRWADLVRDAWIPPAHLAVCTPRSPVEALASPGELVSLVPVHGHARVTTSGLAWPLRDEVLAPGSTRGVSNRAIGGRVTVTTTEGRLLVVRPHALLEVLR